MSETTKATHTPGPWTYDVSGADAKVTYSHGGAFMCGDLIYHRGENEANARLIAAAPDLLAALKLILRSHAVSCEGRECAISGIDDARTAIARAEGR